MELGFGRDSDGIRTGFGRDSDIWREEEEEGLSWDMDGMVCRSDLGRTTPKVLSHSMFGLRIPSGSLSRVLDPTRTRVGPHAGTT